MAISNAARLARCSVAAARLPAAARASSRAARAAADRDRGQSGAAHGGRSGRICRPLRRGGFGRGARPGCPAISSAIHFTDGQMVKKGDLLFTIDRRPFQIALEQMRANLAQARANLAFTEADLARGQELAAEQDHHRAGLRPAHAGQERRGGRGRLAGGDGALGRARSRRNIPSCARRSTAASATAASPSATWSPAAPAATPRCSPPSSRSIRSGSSSPSMRRRICATSASRTTSKRRQPAVDGGVPVALKLIDEKRFRAPRQDGFRRQRHRQLLRHHPRPRGVRQSRRHFHARHVRPHPRARLAALYGAAGSRRRDRHRAGAQISCWWSTTTAWCARNTSRSGQLDGGLRVIKDGLAPTDRVIVNGLMRARPGQKVTRAGAGAPHAAARQGAGTKPRPAEAVDKCASRTSSSTGRSSPPWSRSCS